MTAAYALERRRAAAVRAVGRDPRAELRGAQVFAAGEPVNFASPYLTLVENTEPAVSRGIADALGLLLRHCDLTLHEQLRPGRPLQGLVFDVLEQLRCIALAPGLTGLRSNLDAVADSWCRNARASGVAESGAGLVVYTLTHMARARLGLGMTSEEVDGIIEGARARLAKLVGHALAELRPNVGDQVEFARPAAEIARLVDELIGDAEAADSNPLAARYRMLVPPGWIEGDDDAVGSTGVAAANVVTSDHLALDLDALGGYTVWTRAHDVEVTGTALYSRVRLMRARAELDALAAGQAVSPHRIALRLRRLFGTWHDDEWSFGVEDGVVDGRRLGQLIASRDAVDVFRRPRFVLRGNTVVSILMDNSGSMKAQRYRALATLADTMSRALDLAGVSNEVIGHTTATWGGGEAIADWRRAGEPPEPGRVADVAHVIYKDADTPYRRARHSLAAMVLTDHFRESVDGEAVIWAYNRLLARPEPRKVLVVVSDGAPGESGTNRVNRPGLLADHLTHVVDFVERRSAVEIAALTVDQDVSSVFRRSLPIDLDATLTIGTYGLFDALFPRR